jgi:hypothetical protein
MLHTKHLRQAFIAQKGFLTPSKDAMEDKVKEVISEKVTELVESKKDEVVEKVLEKIEDKKEELEKKVDEVADNTEKAVEKVAEDLGKKLEEASKPLADIIDKLDDNPQIAKAIDVVGDAIVSQIDGREISCSCFGWLVALRISRKSKEILPSKPEETVQKIQIASPSQNSKEQEERPPNPPQSE